MTVCNSLNFEKFIQDVFAPEPGETVLLITDDPTDEFPINADWASRHDLVESWRSRLEQLGKGIGFEVMPVLHHAAIGTNNGVFPAQGLLSGTKVNLMDAMSKASLVIAMTEYSMTGALMQESLRRPGARHFRAASMPLARVDMEDTCLNIDYAALRRRCAEIQAAISGSVSADVTFSTGDACHFDLRHRQPYVDDGYLHRDKEGPPLINLPSGEVWIVPYEGEIDGDPSRTEGVIPIPGSDDSIALLTIKENRIIEVGGDDPAKSEFDALLAVDPMRRNVGELAFGCNDGARISGLFIEDEKAGLHWGLGRSEFLGGTVGVDAFKDAATVLHLDTPYAPNSEVTATRAVLTNKNGARTTVIRDESYCL